MKILITVGGRKSKLTKPIFDLWSPAWITRRYLIQTSCSQDLNHSWGEGTVNRDVSNQPGILFRWEHGTDLSDSNQFCFLMRRIDCLEKSWFIVQYNEERTLIRDVLRQNEHLISQRMKPVPLFSLRPYFRIAEPAVWVFLLHLLRSTASFPLFLGCSYRNSICPNPVAICFVQFCSVVWWEVSFDSIYHDLLLNTMRKGQWILTFQTELDSWSDNKTSAGKSDSFRFCRLMRRGCSSRKFAIHCSFPDCGCSIPSLYTSYRVGVFALLVFICLPAVTHIVFLRCTFWHMFYDEQPLL